MYIGIDASRINPQKTGTERYSFEIVKVLIKNLNHRFILWSDKEKPRELKLFNNSEWKVIKAGKLWTQGRLAWELFFNSKPDSIFIPSHVIPLLGVGKFVVTIHDLAFERFPSLYSPKDIKYQRFAVKTAVKKAHAIITPSKTTKKDLLKYYRYDPVKITVIPHGVDPLFFNIKKNWLDKPLDYEIKKPYILYTGRLETKKNIRGLLKSYHLIRQEDSIKHQLVLVGKRGFGYEEIEREIENLPKNISQDIKQTGYVDDETYKKILANADIFVMPSIYEGFGFPVLEAMAAGVPTVASSTSALKEIVGKTDCLVSIKEPFALAAKLSRLIHRPLEKVSLAVSQKKQAALYTWKKAGQKTLEVLTNV